MVGGPVDQRKFCEPGEVVRLPRESVTHTWSLEVVWSLESEKKQGAEKRQADSTVVNQSLQIEGKSQLCAFSFYNCILLSTEKLGFEIAVEFHMPLH